MMPRTDLPQISNILSRLDVPPGRGGRTCCPIHQGDNSQAFSYDDERGVWYCHRCGFGGDAIELVKRSLDVDFKGALRWIGIESGKVIQHIPKRDLETRRRPYLRLLTLQKSLHRDLLLRNRIERLGLRRLRDNEYDPHGWKLLGCAYSGRPIGAVEHDLEQLLDEIPREVYPRPEELPGYLLSQMLQEAQRRNRQ